MATQPAPNDLLPAPMSPVARVVGVFTSPAHTFEELARRPGFLLAIGIQIAVGTGFFYFLLRRLGAYSMARQSLLQSTRGRAMDPATLDLAINASAKYLHYSLYAVPLGGLLAVLFLGWIVQGISNFLLGQEASYRQALAVVSHAQLVQSLMALLSICVLALMADPAQFQFANPLATNLAYFLDKGSTSPFLYAFSLHLDIFTLWTVALLGLGLAKLGGRKGKFSTAFTAVFALWMAYALAAAGLAAAF